MSVDVDGGAVLAVFEAERRADLDLVLEVFRLDLVEEVVKDALRAFHEAVRADANIHLQFLGVGTTQEETFVGDAAAVLIFGVQEMVGFAATDFAQVLLVALRDEVIFLGLVEVEVFVGVV